MRKRLIFLLIFVAVIIVLRYLGIGEYINFAKFKAERAELHQYVDIHYPYSVFMYIVIYMLTVTLSIPIAALLTVAGGFLFGTILGSLYANVGATIGAIFLFLIVRHLLGKAMQKRYGAQLARFNNEMKKYGTMYLLLVHFVAVIPFFLINVFAGLTQVSIWTFIWTTSLGILPGSLVYAFAGRQLQCIESLKDIFSFNVVMVFVLLALLAVVPMAIQRVRGLLKQS